MSSFCPKLLLGLSLVPLALLMGLALLPEVPMHLDPTVIKEVHDIKNSDMAEWFASGQLLEVNNWNMFVKVVQPTASSANDVGANVNKKETWNFGATHPSVPPVVLFHGFPSSSYEFHRVAQRLADKVHAPVILFDHVGFGFSDKPRDSDLLLNTSSRMRSQSSLFSYSCLDHADQALMLLEQLNVTHAHFVGHDMGDTVLNEIIGRYHRGLLPVRFMSPPPLVSKNARDKKNVGHVHGSRLFFQSITFTNGGMVYKHINRRLSQILLTTPGIGGAFQRILHRVDSNGNFMFAQLKTVWGSPSSTATAEGATTPPTHTTVGDPAEDIHDIMMLLRWHGGHRIVDQLIRYLPDRAMFEARWHPAIRDLHKIVPEGRCGFVWGDSDAVAPMSIVTTLHQELSKGKCSLQVLRGAGHFIQLEMPLEWVASVSHNILA